MVSIPRIMSRLAQQLSWRGGASSPITVRQIDLPVLDVRGTPLPIIGFGTSGLPSDRCSAMVETALALGYRHIDTAQAYGNEAEVGRGIARSAVPRAEIFLSTKLEQVNLGAAAVRRATAESLARLGTDYVDLLMIHWPSEEVPMSETLAAFAHLRAEGKVRNIGVCNFTLDLLREAVEQHGADLLCNQVECHPLLAQKKILPYLQSNGIALVAYSPLGRGRVVRNPILRRIGAKYGKSSAQVSLAWLASQDLVAAIPKASSEAHCRANLEIFDFVLSADDLAEIAGLDTGQRGIDPSWAPNWD